MPSYKEQFNLNIFDHSSVGYCVLELVLDDKGQPVDWIYRYCNQAFADIKDYRLEAMIDRSFLDLFPKIDEKWLYACYGAAYENRSSEMVIRKGKKYHVTITPIGKSGFCSGLIQAWDKDRNPDDEIQDPLSDEEFIIRKLFPEYVSLYRIELNSGKFEILRLAENTNARKLADRKDKTFANFDDYAKEYADSFILEQDREEFLNWHTCRNMKRRLCNTEKITYHYQSVSETEKNKYYEAYAVQGKTDEKTFTIFLGYRSIDSILYKEKATQKRLEKALEEAELRNEIISSIAKTYQYISRIDIQADWFEEISNKDKEQLNFINSGVLSVNNKKVYRQYIAEEYQEAFFKFTDISTLPERMKNEETIAMEYRMKDGNWHKLRFIEKKRDTDGNLTHVLCAIRSISAAKKREASLLYQVAEAKKDAALKSRFLSNMSHDIRTPMNGIIGMIDLANHYPNDLEMQQKCRDQVLESSKHLVSLVSNILDMSKLESGDIIEQELDFDLTEVLSRANTDKQILAEEKNIDYVVDWKKGNLKHVYLVGNPAYLERLLTIVADNAVKFTEPGGTIHVWCWEKSVDDSHVMYEFVCEDNGIGMSEEFISHAFEMFSQENETSRTKYEGAGLGLAIAKKIVERMEGTIEIKSKKGSGTTVTMTLPFKIGQPEKNEISKTDNGTRQEMSFEGMRALIAEDNELNMEIAKFMLENNGIRVECAADGEEAVKKFEKAQPGYYDVIFMDIMMPNMNGWDAARKIRSMKRTDAGTIPIIAMSANAFSEDIINSRISGMNQHLTKPLEEEKILAELKECLSRQESGPGSSESDQKKG